mmetsp:Transcript_61896/g.52441  ORF Transcript_61896/g.52441 Transcript_61896/m.52441 type:complete len:99 (+) Transcript_61896:890-1186(+)
MISIRFDPLTSTVEYYRLKNNGRIVDIRHVPEWLQSKVFSIDSGSFHTCALRQDSLVLRGGILGCWGSNEFGQSDTPSGCAQHITHISLGSMHTCAIS